MKPMFRPQTHLCFGRMPAWRLHGPQQQQCGSLLRSTELLRMCTLVARIFILRQQGPEAPVYHATPP